MVVLFDRDNKYKTILVILLILFAIAVAIGIAVSNIDVKEKPDGPIATVVNDGDLIINYTDGELINFSDNEEHTYKVSITNNSTKKLYYSLYIENPNIVFFSDYKSALQEYVQTVQKSMTYELVKEPPDFVIAYPKTLH